MRETGTCNVLARMHAWASDVLVLNFFLLSVVLRLDGRSVDDGKGDTDRESGTKYSLQSFCTRLRLMLVFYR